MVMTMMRMTKSKSLQLPRDFTCSCLLFKLIVSVFLSFRPKHSVSLTFQLRSKILNLRILFFLSCGLLLHCLTFGSFVIKFIFIVQTKACFEV